MFGFTGAHRTDKTTLAKAVAEQLGIAYYDASVTHIMQEIQVHSVADLTLETRIAAQDYLLQRHILDIENMPRPCITDRTPLDFISYMLGEVGMHNTPPELYGRIQAYVEDCLKATRTHYDTIIACRPLGFYEADPNKPPPNPAYQAHLQLIVEGAMNNIKPVTTAYLKSDDLQVRIKASANLIAMQMQEMAADRANRTLH